MPASKVMVKGKKLQFLAKKGWRVVAEIGPNSTWLGGRAAAERPIRSRRYAPPTKGLALSCTHPDNGGKLPFPKPFPVQIPAPREQKKLLPKWE